MARLLVVLVALLLLPACTRGGVKLDLPGGTAVATKLVYVDRYVYVPINPALTAPEPVAEGPLSQCPMVAAKRKAAVLRANARLREIGEIEGTEVQP